MNWLPLALQNKQGDLRPAVSRQCRDAARSGPRPAASRSGDRLLQRAAHLGSDACSFIRMSTVSLPAGGLSPDHTRWISSPHRFFLPVKVLSRVFRGKFVAGLKTAFHARHSSSSTARLQHLAEPRTFAHGCEPCSVKTGSSTPSVPSAAPNMSLRYLGALHPSRCHLQPPTRCSRRRQRHLPLARLRAWQQEEADDAARQMSSCAASCCMCSRAASYASATSASSPTAAAPACCPSASNYSRLASQQAPPAKAVSPTRQSSTWRCPRLRRNHAHRRTNLRGRTAAPFSTAESQVVQHESVLTISTLRRSSVRTGKSLSHFGPQQTPAADIAARLSPAGSCLGPSSAPEPLQ